MSAPGPRGRRRATLLALATALLLAGPIACGKRGAPAPPEGLENEYTWPRAYPAPQSVLPRATAAEPEEEEAVDPTLSPLPEPANDALSPFPPSRVKTRTY